MRRSGFLVARTRLIYLKDDTRFPASLRGEPRFVALLHRLKLDRFGPGIGTP
jgi:hypothetical protein